MMNKEICKHSWHNNHFTGFHGFLDDTLTCPKCNKDFKYINKDGTINLEDYNDGLSKSIKKFQRNRTEWYRK